MIKPVAAHVLGLLWLTAPVSASAAPPSAPPAPVKAAVSAKPTLLRDDPLLQKKITLEVTDKPLGDVLKGISAKIPADLRASSSIADQRVTLHSTDQPVYVLMDRLLKLLSHQPEKPHGYFWERSETTAKERPAFILRRDLNSILYEQDQLDYPRREIAKMLRDMRDLSHMTAEDRKKYNGDFPYVHLPDDIKEQPFGKDMMPYAKALGSLTDDQIDALMRGEQVPLDPNLFTEERAALRQQQIDQMKQQQEISKSSNIADPFPNGIPEPPAVTPTISVAAEDDYFQPSAGNYLYGVRLNGIQSSRILLNPFDTFNNPNPNRVARSMFAPHPPLPPSPIVDLTPLLADKSITPAQRDDAGFTLQALAKTAHITIYQEDFLKRSRSGFFGSPGITILKAPLQTIILEICDEWNCQEQKVGNDYYFWSRSWALDRAADIPERLVKKWKKRYQEQGTFTLDDYVEFALALTWPQATVTLGRAVPEAGVGSLEEYHMLRTLGRLNSAERAAAFSSDGLALAGMSSWEQQAFAEDYAKDLAQVTGDQLADAVLTFHVEFAGTDEDPTQVTVMNITSNGKRLFGTRVALPRSKPSTAPGASAVKSSSAK